jgi:hypothetical protein
MTGVSGGHRLSFAAGETLAKICWTPARAWLSPQNWEISPSDLSLHPLWTQNLGTMLFPGDFQGQVIAGKTVSEGQASLRQE